MVAMSIPDVYSISKQSHNYHVECQIRHHVTLCSHHTVHTIQDTMYTMKRKQPDKYVHSRLQL